MKYSYFRRTSSSDNLQVLAIVDILKHFHWNYVSILHSEDPYGSAGGSAFVNPSGRNDICIDFRRGIPPSFAGRDYDSLVADLNNAEANVIIFIAIHDIVKEH